MSPIAQVVTKAKVYVNYRSLSKAGLIDNQEAKRLFDVVELNGQDIELLNKSDIDHIKLKFN